MRSAAPVLVALIALCAATLVAAAILIPRPWALDVGAPGDAYFIANSFPPEGEGALLRWTRETTALRAHGAYAGPAALELRLYRDPDGTAGRRWPIAVSVGGSYLTSFEARPGWRRYALALPTGAAAGALTLASPTFQPGSGDPRELGVALDTLRVLPLAGPAPVAHALSRGAYSLALLLIVAMAAWLLRALALGPGGGALPVAALTTGLGASLAAWAWLGPRSFAWGLPTSWPGAAALGAVAGGLGALAWARRGDRARGRLAPGRLALGCGALAILLHLALLLPLPAVWAQLAALLILLAPGALAALAVAGDGADPAERAFLAAAGGIGGMALLLMALHALPGPVPWWLPLLAADLLSAGAAWSLWRRRGAWAAPRPRPHGWLLLPLAVAVAARLWGLGVSEFQGDEAYAMMLAKGVAHGQQEILLVHMKGPVEALLPAGPLAVTGTTSEPAARLPFALAGVALVLGVWALAGRLIGGRRGDVAGFVAALGVAADGLLVAFGRIVQYQTVVLLLSAAALWLCWRFYEGGAARRHLVAAAACASVAVLAHYDGIYAAPALAWLVVAGGRRRGWGPRQWAAGLAPPVAVGLALTLSFYLPFALHEHFGRTLSHLGTRGQGAAGPVLRNNLPGYGAMLSVYATRYVAAAAGLGLLASLGALLVAHLRPRALGRALAALLAAGGLLAAMAPGALALGVDGSLAGLLVLPPLAALVLAPRLPAGLRALTLWLAGALAAHAFLIADPRTHFYTLHAAGWLLLGHGAAALAEGLPRLRPALAAAGAALLTLSLTYTGLVFLRPWPEFERAYPATLLPFYRPPTGEALPDDGLFAFPHKDGWKAAAALFQDGTLRGAMDSNQELFTHGWYLRGQFDCAREPDYFLTANGARPLYIPPGYSHFGSVLVDGVRALEIYSREPVAGPPRSFEARDYEAAYDAAPVPNFPLRDLLSGVVPQQTVGAAWGAGFALRGFDLDRGTLDPADPAFLTLYWRAERAQPATLAPAVLVRDAAGRTVAEAEPFCGGVPSEIWHETYVNDTPFRIPPGVLPPGDYTLHAGVRDIASGDWVPLAGGGELVELGGLAVR